MMMKRGLLAFAAVFVLATVLTACGGNGDNAVLLPAGPTLGKLISSPSVSPVTTFAQTVPLAANEYSQNQPGFPGQANVWDIAKDFSLLDGGDDQFDNALQISVVTDVTDSSFASAGDQTYSELAFYTPTMSASDGVKTAVVDDGTFVAGTVSAITGTYSGFLNATSDSRLQQTLVLSGATGTVTASWNDDVNLCDGGSYNITRANPTYRVVARDTAGNELAELFALSGAQSAGAVSRSADLTSLVATHPTIVLSFEQSSLQESYTTCYSMVDDVSVVDSAGSPHEYVTNGDFETGDMTGWTTNKAAEVQNMTSGSRSLSGLDVKRSFYTVPDKLWGRWVDVYGNNTVSAITATITYSTNLGSDYYGIIYDTPGTNSRAITSWDGSGSDRDIGMVFGNATQVTYVSSSALGTADGDDNIYFDYRVTVPPGGKIAIVNFILMDGTDTGSLASTTDTTAKATEIDTEATTIVKNFWKDNQYRAGMTKEQINAIQNF